MEKLMRRIKERKPLPFGVSQCLYGVSVIVTFTVIGQIAAHVL